MNNPTITSANSALYFASARRAATLFTEGRYTWEYADLDAVAVRSPAYPFGETNDGEYTVNALESSCTCPQFAKHSFCKHEMAVAKVLDEEIKWRLQCDGIDAELQTA